MNKEFIIVRYGEIGLKAKKTRQLFEQALIKNIKTALATKVHIESLKKDHGRIYIQTSDNKQAVIILEHIFGIVSVSKAIKTYANHNDISQTIIAFLKKTKNPFDTIALRVKRTGTHAFSSQDIAISVGADICNTFQCSVDLSHPKTEIFIEIRSEDAYIFFEKIAGPGGLPYGTQGVICAYIDSLDAIIASWFLMCRGCSVIFLIAQTTLKEHVEDFLKSWYVNSYIYDFEERKDTYPQITKISKTHHCLGVSVGVRFDKNIHKAIDEILSIKQECNLPVFTPLIGLTSEKIKEIKERIGIHS